ncbi:MAG TPA: Gfo/Idh/MocA family oxidoreductase [Caldilineaceae bacterium]|nr:Gfo/Idh/MocA family oxidoreductase [Caldilineaceae bacterium]
MSNKVRIALIGAGGWGRQHARILSQHPEVDFCAIVGRTLEKTRTRAAEYGVPYYLDIQEMLDNEQPDLVSLSLPNQGHYAATMAVIEAGYPLLVEKPLVFDLDEADRLLTAAANRNLFFAINFNHRYARPVELAYEAIQAGRLGDLVFATWRFGGSGGDCHDHNNLIETQCHGFDMLEHLCGPIDSIMAQMTDRSGKGYSTLVLALHFANGAVGSLVGSYDSSYAYADTHHVEINGTAGRILIHDTVRQYSFQAASSESAEVWQAGYFNDRDREFHRTFDKHFSAILTAFQAGDPPPIHAAAGRRALVLARTAIESFETGKRVAIMP